MSAALSMSLHLGWHSARTARSAYHPRQRDRDIFEYIRCLGKGSKRLPRRRERVAALKCALTCPQCGVVNRATTFLRPIVEKFQGVLDARNLLNEVLPILHENGAVEHFIVHQILLQNERVYGFWERSSWMATSTAYDMWKVPFTIKIALAVIVRKAAP